MKQGDHTAPQEYLSTKKAAEGLGYTVQHTRLLVRQGHLEAYKLGRDWLIVRESVVAYKTKRDQPEGNNE